MFITKVRSVHTPFRAHKEDAGIDFYIPEDFRRTTLKVGDSIKIPSGIKVMVPHGYALVAFNKSGVATKLGLDVSATVVDEGYSGEVNLCFNKVAGDPITLEPGQKIVQFILIKISTEQAVMVTEKDYNKKMAKYDRGTGGFGSTGN